MLPFSALFESGRDTLIVTSDTAFVKISELEGRRFTLNEYLIRAFPDVPHVSPPDLIRNLNWSEFTDAGETKIAGLIMRKNANNLQRTFLRSGRQVQLADFNTQDIILLGSAISNPWGDLYANELNFEFEFNKKTGIKLVNRSPQHGELASYPSARDEDSNRRYARIAFLPHTSSGKGSALLIAGTTMEATEAAGEFLLNDAVLAKTLRKMGVDPNGPACYWEIVLRATTFMGGATHAEVIGYRLHPYQVE